MFLSAGRCSTQWLAHNLSELYGRELHVTHEPIGPDYRARSMFRAVGATWPPEVESHLDDVADIVARRPYVETGWPLFPAIPRFLERFGTCVRVVHLTRHPVLTALSHMSHQCYAGSPRNYDYADRGTVGPDTPGVFQSGYSERWESLTPFEKCLFWCTEVHLYARELERTKPDLPILRLRAEDLLRGNAEEIAGLTGFLGVGRARHLAARAEVNVDEWHHRTPVDFDWRRVFDHRAALEVITWLGYDFEDLDYRALRERYSGLPPAWPEPGRQGIEPFRLTPGAP